MLIARHELIQEKLQNSYQEVELHLKENKVEENLLERQRILIRTILLFSEILSQKKFYQQND